MSAADMAFRFPSSIFGFDHASMVTSLGDFAKACLPYCIIEWRSYWKPKFSIMSAPYVFITPCLYAVIKRSYNHLLIIYDPLLRGLSVLRRWEQKLIWRAKSRLGAFHKPIYMLARRSLENEHKIKLVLSTVNMLIENKKMVNSTQFKSWRLEW